MLNGAAIKAALVSLGGNRRRQMVFAGIICGTFFKHYNKDGDLVPVRCPLCQQANSLAHLIQHTEMGSPPEREASEKEIMKYLSNMAEVLAPASQAIPLPMRDAGEV